MAWCELCTVGAARANGGVLQNVYLQHPEARIAIGCGGRHRRVILRTCKVDILQPIMHLVVEVAKQVRAVWIAVLVAMLLTCSAADIHILTCWKDKSTDDDAYGWIANEQQPKSAIYCWPGRSHIQALLNCSDSVALIPKLQCSAGRWVVSITEPDCAQLTQVVLLLWTESKGAPSYKVI